MQLKLLFAAAGFALLGSACQPETAEFRTASHADNRNLKWQSAGIAANGYRKPGAAVAMRFALPDDLQPGDTALLNTSWVLEDDSDNLNLRVYADEALNAAVGNETNLSQPTTGQAYELNIPFVAAEGRHTINFIATTQGSRIQKRSFSVIIEAGEAVVVRQKASTISESGERLHRMQTSPN